MRLKFFFTTILLSLILAACGGGDGGSGNSSTEPSTGGQTEIPPTSAMNGIYVGNFDQEGAGSFKLTALVYNGRLFAISEQSNNLYEGNISTTKSGFSGQVTVYEQGGGVIGKSSIQGTFKPETSVKGTFSGAAGSGTFSLAYDPIYERNSDLSKVNDVWSTLTPPADRVTITIDSDGSFTGNDTNGCHFSGTLSIIDHSINLYRVDFTTTHCGSLLNGQYMGFATLRDQQKKNDTLAVVATNGEFFFVYTFQRQSDTLL